jgi:hypothetical protein
MAERERNFVPLEALHERFQMLTYTIQSTPEPFLWNAHKAHEGCPKCFISPKVIVSAKTAASCAEIPRINDDAQLTSATAMAAFGDSVLLMSNLQVWKLSTSEGRQLLMDHHKILFDLRARGSQLK